MSACASDGSETRKPRAARGRDPYTYTYLGLALAAAVTLGCALLRQRQRRAQHAWTSRARLAYLLYPNLMPGRRVLCVEAEDFWRYVFPETGLASGQRQRCLPHCELAARFCQRVIFQCLARALCALELAGMPMRPKNSCSTNNYTHAACFFLEDSRGAGAAAGGGRRRWDRRLVPPRH